jgi:hypothetical protein
MGTLAEAFSVGQEAMLRSSTALRAAMGLDKARIYNGPVPANAVLPYVVLGEDQILGDDIECAESAEIHSTVHVWSRPEPPTAAEAKRIGDTLIGLLKRPLVVGGYVVDEWQLESARYNTDPDGSTHGWLSFRYLITSTAD